jgi:hypothetical protein
MLEAKAQTPVFEITPQAHHGSEAIEVDGNEAAQVQSHCRARSNRFVENRMQRRHRAGSGTATQKYG